MVIYNEKNSSTCLLYSLLLYTGYTILVTIIGTLDISVCDVKYPLKKQKNESYEIAFVYWQHLIDKEQQVIKASNS